MTNKGTIALVSLAVALVIGGGFWLGIMQRVPPGYVGVKVNNLGTNQGVNEKVLPVGRHAIWFTQDLYTFPTFEQNYVWTKDEQETSEENEEISFQSAEGTTIYGDFGITFSVEQNKAALLFQKYRKGIDEIVDGPLRQRVRDAISRIASHMSVDSLYSEGKNILLDSVTAMVRRQVEQHGIKIDRVFIVSSFRFPDSVEKNLEAKINATQKALTVENELREKRAAAEKQLIAARADSASKVIRAAGEAQAIRLKQRSITAQMIQYEYLQKWDGKLPQYMLGSNTQMLIGLPK